jgi:hypothetical protein
MTAVTSPSIPQPPHELVVGVTCQRRPVINLVGTNVIDRNNVPASTRAGAGVQPVLRPGDLPGVAGTRGRGASGETGSVVDAECYTAAGVSAKSETTAVTLPSLPHLPMSEQ